MDKVRGDVLWGVFCRLAAGRRGEGVGEEGEEVPAVVGRVVVCEVYAGVAVIAAADVGGHHAGVGTWGRAGF